MKSKIAKMTALAVALFVGTVNSNLNAQEWPRWQHHNQSLVRLDLVLDGKSVPLTASGQFVIPHDSLGKEFSLRVSNRSPRRVVAVIGIDGLSITGKNSISANAGGYVLQPWKSYLLKGWRTNNQSVEAFCIQRPKDSVAAKQGKPSRIGQIDLFVVEEKLPHRHINLGLNPTGFNSFRSATARRSQQRLNSSRQHMVGTGSGRTISSHTKNVTFQRGKVSYCRFSYGLKSGTREDSTTENN